MSELKCSLEMVQEWQAEITNAKTQFGPGSDEHCKAVAWAEAQGPALVADYLTLTAQLQQEREGWEKLREALENIFLGADTAQQLGGGNSFTRAMAKMAAAALRPVSQAQTEVTPDSGGGL